MTKSRIYTALMILFSAAALTACGFGGGGGGGHHGGGHCDKQCPGPGPDDPDDPTDPTEPPVTTADYKVSIQGPGGHSNGNYGRTSALHAAGRAVAKLDELCATANIKMYVKDIHGGNSVNAIASDGFFTVGLVSGDATAFEAAVTAAATFAIQAENAFRNVTEGQIGTGANAVRLDVRIEEIAKL